MPSNTELNTGSGGDTVTTKQRTHDGDTTKQQVVSLAGVTGTEDAYTHTDIQSGGGTEANALRVTLANDSTGLLSIDDNGGSITVDNAGLAELAAAINTSRVDVNIAASAVTQAVSGTITANLSATDNAVLDSIDAAVNGTLTVGAHAVTNAGTFAVQIDGAALTALQTIDNSVLADDAAFTLASSSVTMAGAIRDDALSALAAAEGDAVPLRVSSTGALHVTGGGGGTEYNEDAATPGTITGTATMMERDDALSTLTPIEGDWAAMRCDSQGALWVNAVNAGGTSNVDTAAGGTDSGAVMLAQRDDALTTLTPADGDYTTLRVSSTGALHVTGGGGGTEYNEDVATPGTITGTATMMERDDALSALTPAEGDWASMRCDQNGALWTSISNTVTVDGSGVTQPISGTVTANLSATDNAVLDTIETNTDFGAVTGGGVEAGALRVTLANDSTGVLSIDDNGGSITVDGTITANLSATDNTVLDNIDTSLNNIEAAVSGSEMQVDVVAALPAGTNNIGDVDVASIAAGTNLVGDVGLSGARTSGGTTLYKNIDVDQTEDQIKGTAGQVYWIHAINVNAALRYLKFYNATAANVTVGTTVPDLTFPVPASATGAGFTLAVPNGIEFGTAITIAATTGVADNDSGAPGNNEVIVNIGYA